MYREIDALQPPFDLGLDEPGRPRVVFNVAAVKAYSTTFAEEIAKLLETAGVGTRNTDIFISTARNLPTDGTTCLILIETGGAAAERTHNQIGPPAYERPTLQLVARSGSYAAARAMAQAAYDALVGVRNQDVTP